MTTLTPGTHPSTVLAVADTDVVALDNGAEFPLVAVLPPALLDEAWDLYRSAFEGLRTQCVQRHVLYRSEFDEVMTDPRVTKFLAFDGTVLTSLGTRTADLDAVTLISPDYFEAKYPEQYAAKAIYYVLFFALRPDYQRSGAMTDLMTAMVQRIPADGVLVLDIAGARKNVYLHRAVHRTLTRFAPGVRTVQLDEQTYFAYELSPTD